MGDRMSRKQMVYQWSSHRFAVDANVVGKTVTAIAKREGMCPPQRLVTEASPDDSPLHPLFTWNDDTAAERWRTHEARQVIGSLVAVTVRSDGSKSTAPAFVSVGHRAETAEEGSGYRPVSVVMADALLATEAVQEALAKLQAIRRRYAALSELSPVWEAIDEVEAEERVATAA